MRRLGVVLVVGVLLPAAWSGVAAGVRYPKGVVEHAAAGEVSANLYYMRTGRTVPTGYAAFKVTIARAGKVLYYNAIDCRDCSPEGQTGAKTAKAIHIVRLVPGQEPVVIVDLYAAGGTHCCDISVIFAWTGGGYRRIDKNWGDPGYALTDIRHDGTKEFLTDDDRFAYEFTDYAHSTMPIEILELAGDRLVNVTRSFPSQVRRDAAYLWQGYEEEHDAHDATRGSLAAWAADEALLGRWQYALDVLRGRSVNADIKSDQTAGAIGTSTRSFLAHLQRFLKKNGYLSPTSAAKSALSSSIMTNQAASKGP